MKFRNCLTGLAGVALLTQAAAAMSPAELQKQLEEGAKVTVIDIRSNEHFTQGHIPGAINVPAPLVSAKKLPPLGKVVVYDAGLGADKCDAAVAAFNAKPGVNAEVLEGGLAAWRAIAKDTTAGRGLEEHASQMITYQQLKANTSDDIVIVDLRPEPRGAAKDTRSDLRTEFPQARLSRSPFEVRAKAANGVPPLLVLVDRGDGSAQEMARTLKANGITRFVVLAGGETIIERKGQPGLQRQGGGLELPANALPKSN